MVGQELAGDLVEHGVDEGRGRLERLLQGLECRCAESKVLALARSLLKMD